MSKHRSKKPRLRLVTEKLHCDQCKTIQLCLKSWLDKDVIHDIDQISVSLGTWETGQAVYKMEDTVNAMYVVHSGAVKIEKVLEDGTNHIDGFFFTGDLFGLDSLDAKVYGYDAIALERTRICQIPLDRWESQSDGVPRLKRMLISALGKKVRQANDRLLNDRYLSVEKRLILFLTNMYKRNAEQNERNNGLLRLPMHKGDIASYLGTRPESVSRALKKLEHQGVIRNHYRYIEIKSIEEVIRLNSIP